MKDLDKFQELLVVYLAERTESSKSELVSFYAELKNVYDIGSVERDALDNMMLLVV